MGYLIYTSTRPIQKIHPIQSFKEKYFTVRDRYDALPSPRSKNFKKKKRCLNFCVERKSYRPFLGSCKKQKGLKVKKGKSV